MFTYQIWKQYQQPHPKNIARSFKNSNEKRLPRDINYKQKKLELKSAMWSDYKYHNSVEFTVSVFPNSTTQCLH